MAGYMTWGDPTQNLQDDLAGGYAAGSGAMVPQPWEQDQTPTSQSFNYSGGGQMGAPAPHQGGGMNLAKLGSSLLSGGPVSLGLGLAGDVIGYLAGGDQRAFQKEQRNNARFAMGKMKSAIGTDVMNPNDTQWAVHAANIPRYNQLGSALDKKFGFDSGMAAGQLANDQLSIEANAYLQSYLENKRLSSARDQQYLTSLAGGY